MNWQLLIGRNWGQRIIILLTVIIYLYLIINSPSKAKESFSQGLKTLTGLLTLIVAAMFLASAIETLVPTQLVQTYLGTEAGLKGVLTGGLLGGVLQGGPYAVYPIISAIKDEGASFAVIITMLVGYGAIGAARIPYGLAFFESKIILARIITGIIITITAGTILYLIFG